MSNMEFSLVLTKCISLIILFIQCQFIALNRSEPLCKGKPLMYNGRRCASTTVFHDGRKGACGCGPFWLDKQFFWNKDNYVAAVNQRFFDFDGKTWCGQRCGQCYELTPTGGFVENEGASPSSMQPITVMITNLCPIEPPNLGWCGQNHYNQVNAYGYFAHFDLENGNQQITAHGWDNPEVTYRRVDCGIKWPKRYRECQCSTGYY